MMKSYQLSCQNITLAMQLAEHQQISLKNYVPKQTIISADPDMIYAVIRNRLSNSLKFSFHGDKINISATWQAATIEVAIADSGVGMNQDDLKKVFREDLSFQTPGTEGEEGIGLGFILCKELVEQHGGSIWAESTVGEGTTFRFTLPKPS